MSLQIETERLILRPLNIADLPRFEEIFAHPAFDYYAQTAYNNAECYLQSRLSRHAPEKENGSYSLCLAVCLNSTSEKLIGYQGIGEKMSCERLKALGWEGGFFIDPTYQNNGYAKESLKAILSYTAKRYNQHAFFNTVSPHNTGSIKVMTEVGYKRLESITDPEELKDFDGPRDIYHLNLTTI